MRELSDDEIAWKREGTMTYQDLTRRSLATMREVEALPAVEENRPRLDAPDIKPLIATRRSAA
jgi:phenylacetic acid degradation protein